MGFKDKLKQFINVTDDDYIDSAESDYSDDFDFEELYKLIEEVIYKYNIPFKKVLEYIYEQIGAVSDYDIFNKWIKYIRLLDVVNENLVFPKNLFYSYNVVREKNGLQPIMYYPSEWKMKNAVAAERHGDIFKVGGYFPVDENNMPALKWIGVWFEDVTILPVNGQVVEYDKSLIRMVEDNYKPALKVSLKFKLTPNSRIFVYRKETLHIDSFTDEEAKIFNERIEKFENGNLENVCEVTLEELEQRIIKLETGIKNDIQVAEHDRVKKFFKQYLLWSLRWG